MRALLQRVTQATVTVRGEPGPRGTIGPGLLVLLGIEEADTPDDIAWLCGKIARLRVFPDDTGVMNRSIVEAGGEVLAVSQFTLFASTRKGNRPSYSRAAPPGMAMALYTEFLAVLEKELGRGVARGEFGADMAVSLVNDGPVTILVDSKARE